MRASTLTASTLLLLAGNAVATTLYLPSAADLDLDNDGTPEITVTTSHASTPSGPFTRSQSFVVVTAHASLQFLTAPATTTAQRQQVGSLVGTIPSEGSWPDDPAENGAASILHSTVLTDPDTGFSSLSFNFDFPYDLGFRFDAPDGTHYGWLRLRPPGELLITRPAITILHYNDTPGAPVTVGTIPEPSTTLLLAFTLLTTLARCRKP